MCDHSHASPDTGESHTHSHSNPTSHPHPHSHSDDRPPNMSKSSSSSSQPPSEDPELLTLSTALSSFHLYRRSAHLTLTHARRSAFLSLPRAHQAALPTVLPHLADIDDAIATNAALADVIFQTGCASFGVEGSGAHPVWAGDNDDDDDDEESTTSTTKPPKPWYETLASPSDIEKAVSTLKQFHRDWLPSGLPERLACYRPIVTELCTRFPDPLSRATTKILVPGAGLGRLAFDLVCAGFDSEGCEWSWHMLAASNWVLNCANKKEEMGVHPWIHSFSNQRSKREMLQGGRVPDVWPRGVLLGGGGRVWNPYERVGEEWYPEIRPDDDVRDHPSVDGDGDERVVYSTPAAERFGMSAGDFTDSYKELYGLPDSDARKFDAVATCFFIDTAANLCAYLDVIRGVLRRGGVWVNLGPLLWHWEGSARENLPTGGGGGGGRVELTLEDVLGLVEGYGGMEIVKRGVEGDGRPVQTGYLGNLGGGMGRWVYEAEFWVAVKK